MSVGFRGERKEQIRQKLEHSCVLSVIDHRIKIDMYDILANNFQVCYKPKEFCYQKLIG
jgi:hypothetical protein